jgi:hypothetical protein
LNTAHEGCFRVEASLCFVVFGLFLAVSLKISSRFASKVMRILPKTPKLSQNSPKIPSTVIFRPQLPQDTHSSGLTSALKEATISCDNKNDSKKSPHVIALDCFVIFVLTSGREKVPRKRLDSSAKLI